MIPPPFWWSPTGGGHYYYIPFTSTVCLLTIKLTQFNRFNSEVSITGSSLCVVLLVTGTILSIMLNFNYAFAKSGQKQEMNANFISHSLKTMEEKCELMIISRIINSCRIHKTSIITKLEFWWDNR